MKKLLSSTLAVGLVSLSMIGAPAMADISDVFGPSSNPKTPAGWGPPASYTNQNWISPQGCTYSRAKAPGYAPTWHLVLNGSQYGLTDAKAGCPILMKTPGN
ncbi:MAG: hypothetical protein ABJN42_00605 [Roseibium sp.]|uniref:hypothetical protein n=1 Tax=Roseibium sp. TaxID=1936156 RepID=UPI0032969CC7